MTHEMCVAFEIIRMQIKSLFIVKDIGYNYESVWTNWTPIH